VIPGGAMRDRARGRPPVPSVARASGVTGEGRGARASGVTWARAVRARPGGGREPRRRGPYERGVVTGERRARGGGERTRAVRAGAVRVG
jgi:hypothetical protein